MNDFKAKLFFCYSPLLILVLVLIVIVDCCCWLFRFVSCLTVWLVDCRLLWTLNSFVKIVIIWVLVLCNARVLFLPISSSIYIFILLLLIFIFVLFGAGWSIDGYSTTCVTCDLYVGFRFRIYRRTLTTFQYIENGEFFFWKNCAKWNANIMFTFFLVFGIYFPAPFKFFSYFHLF